MGQFDADTDPHIGAASYNRLVGRLCRVGSVLAVGTLLLLASCGSPEPDTNRSTSLPATTDPARSSPEAGPAVAVSTGDESACAVAGAGPATGRVWCWSLLDHAVGTGGKVRPWGKPHPIVDLPPVSGLDGSNDEWCAVSTIGEVWCWEDQFRYGADAQAPTPIGLPGPATVVAVGPHSGCALVAGDSWCWKRVWGSRPADRSQPVRTDLGSAAVDLAVGERHACAVLLDRSLRCWGSNGAGELGDGRGRTGLDESDVPVTPVGLGPVVAVAAGANDSCAVLADGSVACWGNHPALPREPASPSTTTPLSRSPCYTCPNREELRTPVPVDGTHGAVAITSATGPGIGAVCTLLDDGTVACWGPPEGGRLGWAVPPDSNGEDARTPVPVPGLTDVTRVDVGMRNLCAVDRSGHVACVGTYALDKLGRPRYVLDPVRLESFG